MPKKRSSLSVQANTFASTALTITFVLLKAWNRIDWSWWWVFSPLWIPFGLAASAFAFAAILLAGIKLAEVYRKRGY